jgi:hypothetical protein
VTPGIEKLLRRFGPLAVGLISPLVIWWVWGQTQPIPVIHDEASYLLQADIFASGRWTAPSPPIPEFFEQPHVQVVPAVASKYPPGHAMLLTPGALVGFPALVPLLLTGITAALLFALVARVSNPWAALIAWPTWLFAPMVLRFQPSYLSELTTSAVVLSGWWALLSWRDARRRRWLLALALCVGWGAITRPLTMLVFAIPIGVVVVADVVRGRRWGDFGLAVIAGIVVLSILPLWSARTTGSWRVAPVEKYRLDYLPFDKIGFTADTTPPRRRGAMSRVLAETYVEFLNFRRQQTLAALPRTTAGRGLAVLKGLFEGVRLPLAVLAIAGLVTMPVPVRFGALSALLLFGAYLPYAHWEGWTVYYLELVPVVAALVGVGAWGIARRLAEARAPLVMTAAAAFITLGGVFGAARAREQRLGSRMFVLERQILELLPRLPSPGILFVRYSPRIVPNPAIVRNSAHLDREPMWIVHDLGARDDELKRLAPHRATHSLDIDRLVRTRR